MRPIETERLILRNFEETDYDDLYEFLSQRRDEQFEAYPGITYENGHEHLHYRKGNDEFIAIELRETGKVIGNIYFGNREFSAKELGYIINKDYQRKGLGSEAVKAVLSAAKAAGVHRVFAECDPRNEASWGLLEHLGFRREAWFRKSVFRKRDGNGDPVWKDTFVYAMLMEDWD